MNLNLRTLILAAATLAAATISAQESVTRVFSHRGGRLENDENTMEAFTASYANGYRGFETDIRMTADGELVVTHDSRLDRTSNGSGAVEKHTAAQVRELVTKHGNKMIFLDELLDFLRDKQGLYVEFEMKTSPAELYPDSLLHVYCDKLYDAVMAAKPADAEYVFTSSDTRGLKYLQEKHPGVDLLFITSQPLCDATIARCKELGINRIGAKIDGTSRADVVKAKKEGLTVSLWPGSTPRDTLLGIYLGADFLCTDVPAQVKARLGSEIDGTKIIY